MGIFVFGEFGRKPAACRSNLLQARIGDSNSTNAFSFSTARTSKLFQSPRCASTIQIVRPSESTADTQPQLHPASLRLSAMISQSFIRAHGPNRLTSRNLTL